MLSGFYQKGNDDNGQDNEHAGSPKKVYHTFTDADSITCN